VRLGVSIVRRVKGGLNSRERGLNLRERGRSRLFRVVLMR
jgi:hypothetical protein